MNCKVGDTVYWKPWGSRALRDGIILSGEVIEYRPGGVFESIPGSAVGCVSIDSVTIVSISLPPQITKPHSLFGNGVLITSHHIPLMGWRLGC